MRCKSRTFLSLLAFAAAALTASAAQPLPEAAWPKTPFSQGLNLPAAAARSPQAATYQGCGGSSCMSAAQDSVCGVCSIACPIGKSSVCYPGVHTEDAKGKESCAQRPACSCN